MNHRLLRVVAVVVTVAIGGRELAAQQDSPQEATVVCHAGEPLGTCFVSLPLTRGEPLPQLSEVNGRALYVVSERRRRGLIRNRGEFARYWFLFRGEAPLELRLATVAELGEAGGAGGAGEDLPPARLRGLLIEPEPQAGGRDARQLTLQWWGQYRAAAEERIEGDTPPVVDQYLLAMLAKRMRMPLEIGRQQQREEDRPLATLELLSGGERLRAQMLREAMLRPAPLGLPALNSPRGLPWLEPPSQPVDENVELETLARHAPPECFYIRFGKFSNFLWMTHLIKEQGGDLQGMIASRGLKRDMNDRFERQFAIRYSVIADLLGDQVVSDLALIGTDLYLQDGAAMGVLLEAKNSLLLDAALSRERSSAMKREAKRRVRRTKVTIGKHEVDLIATPDNSVRSFLVARGNLRLVTNSRHVAERFLAVQDGGDSLADTNEFQHARSLLPVSRGDTIYAFFSSYFFHNLVSPQYQIELRRRLVAINDFQMLELAQLAARREGIGEDEPTLVAAGLLPADWGRRVDRSRLKSTPDGWVDSVRGGRGTLLPIPDTPLGQVTQHEWDEQQRLETYYRDRWQGMDPLVLAVGRYAVEGHNSRERLVIDGHISPFVDRKYGVWGTLLGPSTTERVAAPADAVIQGQASLRGGVWRPEVPHHQLFFGILDRRPAIADLQADGLIDALRTVQAIPGYLGAWPNPGMLSFLPFSAQNQEDAEGFSRLPFRLWRWRGGEFSAFAFNRELLRGVQPSLEVVEAEAPSQIWARVRDLTETQLAPWIRQLNHQQAVRATRGNAQLLDTLSRQLGAEGAEAKAVAQRLLDAQLDCPLGGDYQLASGAWRPTADLSEPPADYESPLLSWFRGGAVLLNGAGTGRLTMHAEIDLQRAEGDGSLSLPLLDGLPQLWRRGPK